MTPEQHARYLADKLIEYLVYNYPHDKKAEDLSFISHVQRKAETMFLDLLLNKEN